MVKVADVVLCSPESVCLVADDLGLVVETLNGAIVDGHPEIVHQVLLMASQHPGELPHGFETGVGGSQEPLIEVAFGPSGTSL